LCGIAVDQLLHPFFDRRRILRMGYFSEVFTLQIFARRVEQPCKSGVYRGKPSIQVRKHNSEGNLFKD